MKIIGFLGSARVQGRCGRLLRRALEGAASKGAEVKRYDLIASKKKSFYFLDIDCCSFIIGYISIQRYPH